MTWAEAAYRIVLVICGTVVLLAWLHISYGDDGDE